MQKGINPQKLRLWRKRYERMKALNVFDKICQADGNGLTNEIEKNSFF